MKPIQKSNPIVLTVRVNKPVLPMELDTGVLLSIISEETYKSISSATDQLKPTDVSLCTYTGETLTTLGCIDVQVKYESRVLFLPLVVLKGQGPSLSRRNWLEKIKLNWTALYTVTMSSALDNLFQQHQNLFLDCLGI